MSALVVFVVGMLLIGGAQWAGDSSDASVRYVARTAWGLAAYLLGIVLVVVGLVIAA